MEPNKVETRVRENGTIEHKHTWYGWWHPVTRIHSTPFMLECNVGCNGEMWTSTNRNVEVLKKDMIFSLQQATESQLIENRVYWMKEVLRLTTWGIVPVFKVDNLKQEEDIQDHVGIYYSGQPDHLQED